MNERPEGRSKRLGSRFEHGSRQSGQRAPAALVIRLEVGAPVCVVADWDTDEDDEQMTSWLDECPRIRTLAFMAVQLAEEAA